MINEDKTILVSEKTKEKLDRIKEREQVKTFDGLIRLFIKEYEKDTSD